MPPLSKRFAEENRPDPGIVVRYRSPISSTSSPAAIGGYYSYLWSEVLDADASRPSRKPASTIRNAKSYRDNPVKGNTGADGILQAFRGREPRSNPCLSGGASSNKY